MDAEPAVVVVDTAGVIRYWSAGATELFGLAEPVGETLDVIVPDAFREPWESGRSGEATRPPSPRSNRSPEPAG